MGSKALGLVLLLAVTMTACGPAEEEEGRLAVVADVAELVPGDAVAFFFIPSFSAFETAVLGAVKNTPLHLQAASGLAFMIAQMGPLTAQVDKDGPLALAVTLRDMKEEPELTFIARVRDVQEARRDAPEARWSGRYAAYSATGRPGTGSGTHPLTRGLEHGMVVGAVDLRRVARHLDPALATFQKFDSVRDSITAIRRVLGSLEVMRVSLGMRDGRAALRVGVTLREGTVLDRRSRDPKQRNLDALANVLPPEALFSLVCASPFDGFLAAILPGVEGTTGPDDDGPLGLGIVKRSQDGGIAGVLISPESSRSSRAFAEQLLSGHDRAERTTRSLDALRFEESVWKARKDEDQPLATLIPTVIQRVCLIEDHAIVTMGGDPRFLVEAADRFNPEAVPQHSPLHDVLGNTVGRPILAARGRLDALESLVRKNGTPGTAGPGEFEMFMGVRPGEFVLGLAVELGPVFKMLEKR